MEVFVIILTAFAICIFLYIRHQVKYGWYGKKHKRAYREMEQVERKTLEQIDSLGNSAEEREKGINRLFDAKRENIYYIHGTHLQEYLGGKKNRRYIYGIIKHSRNIASIPSSEREFLRTAFLLYNYNKISYDDFMKLLCDMITGERKATVETDTSISGLYFVEFEPSNYTNTQHADAGLVERAKNQILQIIEKLPDTDPIKTKMNNRIRGGGLWLDENDISNSAFAETSEYKLKLGHLLESNKLLYYSGEGSLITIAPPGSGKTQCFVLPNMLSWPGSTFVLDIKGEIYDATHKWRSQNVGKVIKFSPLDPSSSHHYNPLTFIRSDRDYIWEDSRFLADMIIVPSGSSSDPFWENTARDILTAAIAYVSYNNESEDRPMSKVLDIMYGIGLIEMIVDLKNTSDVAAMRQTGHSLYEIEKKTIDSVLKTAQSHLSAWQGERINRVTKKSDWSPLDLRNEKLTVYLCINPSEIDSYLSLLRVIIAQHIRMLTSKLPDRNSAPVLFMIDELPRLKKMLPIEEGLEVGRQYKIKLWLFAQSHGQLKQAYPNVDGFVGSCAVRIFMNIPLNDELAGRISNQLGYRESPLDNSRQKMVEPLELAGPDYRDVAIVLASNSKPARVRKAYAWQDPELVRRMNI